MLLGAFGAHGLKKSKSPQMMEIWHTAVQYQFVHTLAMLFSLGRGTVNSQAPKLFAVGIAIFSGSLYALVLTGERRLGAVTPIGGVALAAGWVAMFLDK